MQYKITSYQQELLDKIFSGILPHDTFNVDVAADILEELGKVLRFRELYGIYYAMWKIIRNLQLVKMYRKNYDSVLNSETFEKAITVGLNDLIIKPAFDAKRFFQDYGKSFDLSIPKELKAAIDFTYSTMMDKYEEMEEMAVPSSEALSTITLLKADMKQSMATMAVTLQGQVLTNGVFYDGKTYHGFDDWVRFNSMIHNEITTRFGSDDIEKRHQFNSIRNYEDSLKYDKEHRTNVRPLWYMGFEPVDSRFPIRSQDIFVLIADEGVGKTRFVIDQAYRAMKTGNNVVFIAGETECYKIKKGLESRHIWDKYKKQFSYTELDDPMVLNPEGGNGKSPEEVKSELMAIIHAGQVDLYENKDYGSIRFVQNICYEDIEQQLKDEYNKEKFDVVFIDHVGALDYNGHWVNGEKLSSAHERITHLFKVEDRLVKELNIAFFNTSHTSTDATQNIRKGKKTGVRAGAEASATTKYASFAALLTQSEDLRKGDQVLLEFLKVRDWEPLNYPIVLNRRGVTNCHEYIEGMQYLVNGESEVNADIDELY